MRLKRLELVGFKSFADRTILTFEPGITAIIGPNGSGKSNVVDGIKWVLGETRPKSLRGDEMQDVVFKGAEGRAASGFAEVTLILDNEDGVLAGRGPEVAIGRRLFRTGESEYLVDRQLVRRKDVRELLLDTGLGVGAYSVMEQGRIDAVLSANPEDRRQIFEEASGISRFKLRRKEALSRLERTEQNLVRLTDLLEEKERHLRSLKIQAGRARRYQELRQRLVTLRIALGLADSWAAEEERRRLAAEAEAMAARQARTEEGLAEAGRSLEEARRRESQLEQELTAQGGVASDLRAREEGLRERLRAADQRLGALTRRVAEASEARQRILASRTRQEEEYFAAQARSREQAMRQEELRERLHGAREAHAVRAAELRRAEEARRQAEEESLERLHEIGRAGNRESDAEARQKALGEGCRRLEARLEQVEALLAEAATAIGLRREEVACREAELAAARTRRGQARSVREESRQRAVTLQRDAQALREERQGLQSRAEVLRDLELSLAGLGEGPRQVLAAGREGVLGRLVDSLECSPEHARALEAALGERVHALLVDTAERARAVVAWLREDRLGQVHLVLSGAAAAPVQAPPGLQPLLELVQARPGRESLVTALLGRAYLAADVEAGLRASADLPPGAVCVTLAGDRLEQGFLHSGGHAEVGASPLLRRSELKRLDETILAVTERLAALQAALEESRRLEAEAGRDEEAAARLEAEADRGRQQVAAELLRAEERAAAASREREVLRLELAESDRARAAAAADLEAAREALRQARCAGAEADRLLTAARQAVAEAAGRKEEASQEEARWRLEQATCQSDLEGLQARLAVLARGVEENGLRVEELRTEAEEAQGRIETTRAEVGVMEEEVQALLAKRAETEAVLQGLQARREAVRGERGSLEAAMEALRGEREELRQGREGLRFRERELGAAMAGRREKLLEEHGLDLDWFLRPGIPFGPSLAPGRDGTGEEISGPPLPPAWAYPEEGIERIWEEPGFDPAAARSAAAEVRSAMDRIGAVNLRAVAELAEEEEGVALLARQEADLKEARRALQEMIDRINQESARLFRETFEQARANFQELFRKLFQGGKADIQLAEGGDPLEAGIEIVARPPGKQLQNISLLSGGERSLCALAILFAVFKVKPSPFAVLDEVDAALDDSNVDRFLQVVVDFVARTQFLVVTHNKRTMAAAAVLYGITMQRRGISTCVSVRLEEVGPRSVAAAPA